MYRVKKRVRGETSKRAISVIIACILLFTSTGIQVSLADEVYCSYGFFDTGTSDSKVGQYSSIIINSSGDPSACYYDVTSGDLKFAVVDSFSTTIDSSGDVGQYCSMKANGSTIHVSYYDETNHKLKYAVSNNSGANWSSETVDTNATNGKYSSIAIDPQGYPHISYYDESNGDLKHAYKNSSQGWLFDTVTDGQSGNVGQYSSIAVDSSGKIHVSYYDSSNSDLWYAYKSGSDWNRRAVDNNGTVGQYSSIALNSSGRPMIGYYDATNGNAKYAFENSSGDWQTSTVNDPDNARDVGKFTSIACDSNNKAHISYYDTIGKLKYGYLNDTNWQVMPVDDMQGESQNTSIVTDSQNRPHISYYDVNRDALHAQVNAPLITSTDPSSDSTGASATKSITIKFNKSIQTGTNFGNITLKEVGVYGFGDSGTVSTTRTVSGDTITLSHDIPLKYQTKYTLEIPAGAISNYPIAYSLNFTTQSDTGPTVKSTDPTDGATNVNTSNNIMVTFNENVVAGSGSSTSIGMKDPDGKPIQITPTFKDNILTIKLGAATNTGVGFMGDIFSNNTNSTNSSANYGSYTYGKKYTITIPAGSVSNSSNKSMATTYTFSFTTVALGPTVSLADPTNGATEVPLSKTITLKFADTIYTGSSWSNITLKNADGNTIAASISLSNQNSIVIDPTSDFVMGVTYKVNIPSDAVKDANGKYMQSAYVYNFTTIKPIIPAAPTRLKVTKTAATSIALSWVESKSALSYNVYRRVGKEGFTKLFNTSSTTFTDISAAKKTTYLYAVTAMGTGGESAKSSEVPAYIGMTLPQFADVSNGDWFKVYVDALCKRNAISGYSDDLFHPESNITRAEFAKILCTAMGWPLRTPRNPTYNDVSKTHWAFAYVQTATSNKAFSGYIDRSFRPDEKLTRADAAKIAATALHLRKGSSRLKDINKSWAKNYINMCVYAHVINGFPDGTYKPALTITRAEAARIICGMVTYNTKRK